MRVIFWNVGFNFIDEIGVDVSSFGVDIICDMCEECDGGGIEIEVGEIMDSVMYVEFLFIGVWRVLSDGEDVEEDG